MKLTVDVLQSSALLSLGDAAFRLHVNACCWASKNGEHVPAAVMANLPNAPRGKALDKALLELCVAELWAKAGGGYELSGATHQGALSAKRAEAGRRGGVASGESRRGEANEAIASSATSKPKQTDEAIASSEAKQAQDPSLSLSPSEGFSAASSGGPSLLSSGSGPESKPARVRRWRRVPADWAPNEGHRQLAAELRVDLESQLGLYRDHEFKDPKSDPDATFRTWLKRAAGYHPPSGPGPGKGGSSLPVLMDRIQRMEAGDEGN